MKIVSKILFLLPILFAACSQSMIIKDLPAEKGGHLLYGNDNARNFYEPITISDSLKLKWELSTHGSYNNSSIVAYAQYMLVHDLSGNITCFNLENGKELGAVPYAGSIYAAPVIYKSRMFFIVNNSEERFSTAYYYDLQDGKILAETKMQGSFSNQLLKDENAFYAVSDNGQIYKFNFAGINEWKYDSGVKVQSTPAMSNGKIVFVSIAGELVVFDHVQKRITVKKNIGASFYGGVVISGKEAYSGDADGTLYCFNIEDGTLIWKGETKNKIVSLPVYNDKYVYVTNLSGVVSCFDRKNGELKWMTKIGGAPISTPILFNNYLLQPNLDSYLYFLNPVNGMIEKKKKFSGRMKMTPVLFNNLLFFGFDKGNIEAFEITEVK